jgi:hypothetical protein
MEYALRSYHASSDTVLDPFRRLDQSASLVVVDGDRPGKSLGRAFLAGWLLDGGSAVATYRLMIGGEELSGVFIRLGRRFEHIVA